MKLLREFSNNTESFMDVGSSSKGYYITGVFMQGNIQNRNGRIYPTEVLASAVEKYRPLINEGRASGELNHPDSPSINLERVSHIITELTQVGDDFVGKAKILDTPMGQIVKAIMQGGGKIGVSSRGLGSVKVKNNVRYVQSDFMLTTAADIVSDPSAPKAIVENLIESAEWEHDGKNWIPKFRKDAKAIMDIAIVRKEKEAAYIKLFEEFISKI